MLRPVPESRARAAIRRRSPFVACAGLYLGLLVSAHALPAAAEDCPAAIVQVDRYSGAQPFPVTAAVYDSAFAPLANARITFDRFARRAHLEASSGGRLQARVRIVERFDLSGVPPGTAVDATVALALDGWSSQLCGGAGCGVRLEGTLVVGADSLTADANQNGPSELTRPLAATLSLPVRLVAGTPVTVQCFLDYGTGPGQNGASGELVGVCAIGGLPPGASAVACPEWTSTAARRHSWGALRLRYR